MPYIKKDRRKIFDDAINIIVNGLGSKVKNNPVEIKRILTSIKSRLDNGADPKDISVDFYELDAVLSSDSQENAAKGDANYVISSILWKYLVKNGIRYHRLNDFIGGVLSMVQAELTRRVVNPYEDLAIEKNGDLETWLL